MRTLAVLLCAVVACGGTTTDWSETAERACNDFVGIDLDYTAGDITSDDAATQIQAHMTAASEEGNEALYDQLEDLWDGTFEDWDGAADRFDEWCRENRP